MNWARVLGWFVYALGWLMVCEWVVESRRQFLAHGAVDKRQNVTVALTVIALVIVPIAGKHPLHCVWLAVLVTAMSRLAFVFPFSYVLFPLRMLSDLWMSLIAPCQVWKEVSRPVPEQERESVSRLIPFSIGVVFLVIGIVILRLWDSSWAPLAATPFFFFGLGNLWAAVAWSQKRLQSTMYDRDSPGSTHHPPCDE